MQLDVFQVLADPTRRTIVEALFEGEKAVSEVVARSGIHQSGVSRHLRILQDAGFVAVRPEGQRRLYRLQPAPFRELEAWLAQTRQLWQQRLGRFEVALAKQTRHDQLPTKGKQSNE